MRIGAGAAGLGAVAIALTAGCDPDRIAAPINPHGVIFQVPAADWGRNDTIPLLLVNETEHSIGYNLCTATLERRIAGQWERVTRLPPNTDCILPLYHLPPGDSVYATQPVYDFIEAGTYRFRAKVEWPVSGPGRGNVELVSNTFRIRR